MLYVELLNIGLFVIMGVLIALLWKGQAQKKESQVDVERMLKKLHIISLHAIRSNMRNSEATPEEVLDYYHQYIREGGNGHETDEIFKKYILKNTTLWKKIISDKIKYKREDILDVKHYDTIIDLINKRLM